MKTEQIYISIAEKRKELGLIYHIALIQLRGGFRVSEVLAMSYKNIISDTDIYIIASKNSRSRRVHVPEITKELVKWQSNQMKPFTHISRFQVYRAYKRLGIVLENAPGRNKSVTHAMRKLFVQENFRSTDNIEIAAELVGHKSSKSTEYYVKNKKN